MNIKERIIRKVFPELEGLVWNVNDYNIVALGIFTVTIIGAFIVLTVSL